MRATAWGASGAWVVSVIAVLVVGSSTHAQQPAPDDRLRKIVANAVAETIDQFKEQKLKEADVAVTLIDLREPEGLRSGNFRGDAKIFPASVVKLFYIVTTHRWLEDGKLAESEELRRTMHDMIVDSSNDATAMIVDALTETLNGPPLDEPGMKQWAEKRNAVNRYFASLGYTGINVCQKTYCEGPYGRERIFLGPKYENRNAVSTDAVARLLSEIVRGKAVSPQRSKQIMDLLKRDPTTKPSTDDQNTDFTARALPTGTKLWSKAGWTSTARHDAAYIELPDGAKWVLVIFTTGHAREREILPAIAKKVLASARQARPSP